MTKQSTNVKNSGFKWQFRRLGGLDQVVLRNSEDLCRLHELDPKLWVALSCPASGLEFDSRTLDLIDTDRDGRIRIPEVIAAIDFICRRLKSPEAIMADPPPSSMPLEAIATEDDEGKRLAQTGRAILDGLGKRDADSLAPEDVQKAAVTASDQMFNGDGILPPRPEFEPEVQRFIQDAIDTMGGVQDAGGQTGVNEDIARAFHKSLEKWRDWRETISSTSTPLGEDTPEAWDLLGDLREKIDDFFLRSELAAYSPESTDALNLDVKAIIPADSGLLQTESMAHLPLAKVSPEGELDLKNFVNPAWRDRVIRFGDLMRPLLTRPEKLTSDDWKKIKDTFGPYGKALSMKPAPEAVDVTFPPSKTPLDKLGGARIQEILAGDALTRVLELARRDKAVPAAAADIAKVEKLVYYYCNLYRLLKNFVSFEDFFAMRSATFQSGTLFIDGRSCRLCMPAEKPDDHATLAALGQMYLLYCRCERGVKPGSKEPAQTMGIVAAVTDGDADLLLPSRHGVFVDNTGKDWDATVVKIMANPINLWQAVWSPYKKFGNMVTEWVGKFAAAKQSTLMDTAGKKLDEFAASAAKPAPAGAAPFDIGKNVGIFAAIGLALGALGTAAASIFRAFFAMSWWQFPLLIFGLFVIVSGPSVLIAWLKLSQRTLGPLLEASGWAVNGKVAINYALSRRLTATAVLPENIEHGVLEPFVKAHRRARKYLYTGIVVGILVVGGYYLWRSSAIDDIRRALQTPPPATAPASVAPTAPTAPAAASAPAAPQN